MNLTVKTSKSSYEIIIENQLFSKMGGIIKSAVGDNRVFVVSDTNVWGFYGDSFTEILKKAGVDFSYRVLPFGEKTKSLSYLGELYSDMASGKFTRSDFVIAFGGGVIGDLAGFLAATYLRGVKLIQIPTTLLSQVDSSVGGKVAIDLPEGKNLVGSFYSPIKVLIDPDLLKTLPERVFNDGMAEVIKYGCIRDAKLFEILESCNIDDVLSDVIGTCVDIKRVIAENDEFDTGERMLLNFGHTYGHVVECAYNYETYTHGEGVAVGMLRMTKKTENMGITEKGSAKRLYDLLLKYNLIFEVDIDKGTARDIINLDKKSSASTINYVVLEKIGNAVILKRDKTDDFLIE